MSCLLTWMVALLLLAPQASAMECGEANEDGVCLDAGTFQWCEDGELKSAKCPDGQICVTDNPFYDGAGCVSTDETACGEISAEGECTSANGVVWCDEGVPMVFPCGNDSVCGWDQTNGEYDCLPRSNSSSDSDAMDGLELDTTPDDEADIPEEQGDTGPEPDPSNPEADAPADRSPEPPRTDSDEPENPNVTPSVTPTDTSTLIARPPPQEHTGCQGGRSHGAWLTALAALMFIARRRDDDVVAASRHDLL
jgi:hypothetical protein